MLRECVVLVSLCVFGAGSLSGRGFFCRDPDTGKLHAVNTTWPATSFCGNYHCKLRKKTTGTEYAPQRQFNITKLLLAKKNTLLDKLQNESNTDKKIPEIVESILNQKGETESQEKNETDNNNGTFRKEAEQDRYLSEKEISSLTSILHSVKKSDLEAIVEIYNLAQDIYKEIDRASTDHVLEEIMNSAKTIENQISKSDLLKKAFRNNNVSYWYEPLANIKVRPADLLKSDMQRGETLENYMIAAEPIIDLGAPAVNVVKVNFEPPKPTGTHIPPPQPSIQLQKITEKFFNGPLSRQDFGKLPYYYPMSNFQRMSSYKHEQKQIKTNQHQPDPVSPKPTLKTETYKPFYGGAKYQKDIKPSILLPYPFSGIHHYNWSSLLYRNHVDKLQSRRKTDNRNTLFEYITRPNNVVLMNPDLENFQDLEVRPSLKNEQSVKTNERRKPDWQTDSLPQQILDEVRAHMQEKQKLFIYPFPLRRKVKLERVGKLIKLDEATRTKRMAEEEKQIKEEEQLEPELYEMYIEKTTCNSDYTVPGYFRYGNLTQPFPDCCPQRIPTYPLN